MHELPITQGLLELVLQHAAKEGEVRVTGIHLVIGELANVVDDSVQFYWDIVSEGTPAVGAKLHFRRVPLTLRCRDCDHVFRPGEMSYDCVACSSPRVDVEEGDAFRLEAIDVEPAAAAAREPRSS